MVFRFHSGQSLRASIECEAPLYYNLRDTAGNPLIVSKDRVREIVPLADIEPCPDAFSGAATDPGHSWDGDACSLCGKSRKAAPSAPTPPVPDNTTGDGCPGGGYHYPGVPCDGSCNTTGDEGYPGELEHLRSLLRDVSRLADTQPKGNPLTELLIDHYSDSRMVDAQLAKEQAAVRRSVDAQFPVVAAFLAEENAGELARLRELKRRVTEQLEDFEEGLEEDPGAPAVARNMTALLARAVRGERS